MIRSSVQTHAACDQRLTKPNWVVQNRGRHSLNRQIYGRAFPQPRNVYVHKKTGPETNGRDQRYVKARRRVSISARSLTHTRSFCVGVVSIHDGRAPAPAQPSTLTRDRSHADIGRSVD